MISREADANAQDSRKSTFVRRPENSLGVCLIRLIDAKSRARSLTQYCPCRSEAARSVRTLRASEAKVSLSSISTFKELLHDQPAGGGERVRPIGDRRPDHQLAIARGPVQKGEDHHKSATSCGKQGFQKPDRLLTRHALELARSLDPAGERHAFDRQRTPALRATVEAERRHACPELRFPEGLRLGGARRRLVGRFQLHVAPERRTRLGRPTGIVIGQLIGDVQIGDPVGHDVVLAEVKEILLGTQPHQGDVNRRS